MRVAAAMRKPGGAAILRVRARAARDPARRGAATALRVLRWVSFSAVNVSDTLAKPLGNQGIGSHA